MNNRKETLNRGNVVQQIDARSIISYKEMMKCLQKMKSKGHILTLQFDPLGYLHVNGADQTEPDDFLLYRKGTLYGSINGTYHCAGKLDEHCRTVAIVQKQKFIAERGDGNFDYSSRKVALQEDYSLLVYFKTGDAHNLLIADGSACDHVRVLTMDKSGDHKFLLLNGFFALLEFRDPHLAALAREWYGKIPLGNFYAGI